jgi:hypothetical protein
VKGSSPVPREAALRGDPEVTDPSLAGSQSHLASALVDFVNDDAGQTTEEDKPPHDQGENHVQIEADVQPMNAQGEDGPPPDVRPPLSRNGEEYGATAGAGQRVRILRWMQESRERTGRKWVAWIANALKGPELSPEDRIYQIFAHQEYNIQDRASDPIAFSATSDPDTMYWHQAMQQPDKVQFLKAAVSEVKSYVDNKHIELTKQSSLPKGAKVLAAVWSMKRKRRILSQKVFKWKARLNCHGGQQEHGVNFWETYSPVMNWFSIRLFLVTSIIQQWET